MIGYATGEAGTYVDDAGRSIALPDQLASRSVTTLAVDGEEVGILIRAGEVETDEALVEGVAAAAQLALANARLQRQARRTINDLASSRQRLSGRRRRGAITDRSGARGSASDSASPKPKRC